MIFPDINVLIYAHKQGAVHHEEYAAWLTQTIETERFATANIILSGFIRITTHPKLYTPPSTLEEALTFCHNLVNHPNCTVVTPTTAHWTIFTRLCQDINARGNDVTDAYLAALAVEHDCEFMTADKGFRRFPGLHWRHPLE